MQKQQAWCLESDHQFDNLMRQIAHILVVKPVAAIREQACYLDTFDWRIWRQGDVLVHLQHGERQHLQWRQQGFSGVHTDIPVEEVPSFIDQLPEWLCPKRLKDSTGPRALLPLVRSRIDTDHLDVINHDKVVVRLERIQEYLLRSNTCGARLTDRVVIRLLRGFEGDFARINAAFENSGLYVCSQDSLAGLLALEGRKPCDYSCRVRVNISPEQRADTASKQILLQLYHVMQRNVEGICKDTDSEFLTDFRDALRRSLSLMEQLYGIFPPDVLARFTQDMKWLYQETASLQDYNQLLLHFDKAISWVIEVHHPALQIFHDWLKEQRHHSLICVDNMFSSVRYQRFIKGWRVFLECEVPQHSVLEYAEHNAGQVVASRMAEVYQKLCKLSLKPRNGKFLKQIDFVNNQLLDLLQFSRVLFPRGKRQKILLCGQKLQQACSDQFGCDRQLTCIERYIKQIRQDESMKAEVNEAMQCLQKACRDRAISHDRRAGKYLDSVISEKSRKQYGKLITSMGM